MRSIRVLHLIDGLRLGGRERQFLALVSGLQRSPEFDTAIALTTDRIEYRLDDALEVVRYPLLRRWRFDPGVFANLARAVREFRPDILHSWLSMCSGYCVPVAKRYGIKFVNGYVRAAPPKLTLLDKEYFWGKLTQPFSDVVVSNSRAGLAAYGVPTAKGVCIHNGFDQRRLEGLAPPEDIRRALGISTRHIVGMVASFSARKDYGTFFRAAQNILAKRDDVTFLAIGDGEQLPAFQARFATERQRRIRFLGARLEVESIVQTFSLGVLTSNADIHGEGISNAITEYMALAKPAVATDCGGNRELIVEDTTGFLIGGGDADALTSHIANLLDNPDLARRLGDNGRNRVRELFSMESMTEAYSQLYKRLLGQS